jgi:hypothetical protein
LTPLVLCVYGYRRDDTDPDRTELDTVSFKLGTLTRYDFPHQGQKWYQAVSVHFIKGKNIITVQILVCFNLGVNGLDNI